MIAPRISPLPSTAAQLLPSSPSRPDRPSVPRTSSSLYRNFLAFTRHTFSGDRARQRPPSKTPRPSSSPHSAALPAESSRNGALMPKSRISLTAPAIRNSSRFTARRKSQPQTTIQPCARKCVHWNLRRKTHSLAHYVGSLWVFSARSALGTTRTAGTSPSGKPSSAPRLVNLSLSSFPFPTQSHPGATCGCNKFLLDLHGDHTSTCKSHSGATKAHDWMVTQLSPLFGITGHKVKTQGITPSSGLKRKRGDLEIINYLSDSAGSRNLVIDLSITHDRHGSSSAHPHLNGTLSHPDSPDTPLNEAAKRKVNKYRNTYINHHSISFLPAITSTSSRIHSEFLRLLFLQAHFCAQMGLIAAKAAALRINMNTDSCLVASRTASRRLASSHATSLLNSSLSHHLPRPQPFPHPNGSAWRLRRARVGERWKPLSNRLRRSLPDTSMS